jgi:hypothetical protein
MFEKATKAKRFFKVALWGDKKSGKTRGALSFPGPCVIDGERGTLMYAEKYDFSVRDANHWKELLDTMDFLETTKDHGFLTLVIDPLTIFWQDLCDQQVEYVRNRRGNEILSTGDWGMIKRRWKNLMNRLIDIDMHVVLVMREKDQYDSYVDPKTGEEKSRRTGEHLPDAEKSTGYVFDFILHCYTEENKKKGESRHFVQIDGSRRDELAKYATFETTNKELYKALFLPMEGVLKGEKATSKTRGGGAHAPPTPVDAAPDEDAKGAPPLPSAAEAVGDIMSKFAGPDPNEPAASGEDLKVLMTRAGQLRWSDDTKFNTKDGKALIKALFKVESTKDLKKSQADFLYAQFGEVLAGRAYLARDEKGNPMISAAGAAQAV